MMGSARQAFEEISQYISDNNLGEESAGIAVAIEVFERLLDKVIHDFRGQTNDLDSNQRLRVGETEYTLNFTAEVLQADATEQPNNVFLRAANNQNNEDVNVELDIPVIDFVGLSVRLKTFLKYKDNAGEDKKIHVGEILIDFEKISAVLTMVERLIEASLLKNERSYTIGYAWESNQQIKDKLAALGFLESDFEQLKVRLQAIGLITPDAIAEQLLLAIELPDIFAYFPGVKFDEDGLLAVDPGSQYLMFASKAILNFDQCPYRSSEGELDVRDDPEGGSSSVFIPQDAPARNFPVDTGNRDNSDAGSVFLYAPKTLFQQNFDGIARPAVGFSDKGRSGIVRWKYTASLLLNRFALSLLGGPELRFLIAMKLGGVGFADAKVKIGSVTTRVAAIAFQGDIDISISFKIFFDFLRKEVVLISKIDEAKSRGFDFLTSAPWPLSLIAEYLLKRVAKKAIRDQAGLILNKTRIPIANWSKINEIANVVDKFPSYYTDDAITFGCVLKIQSD